MHRFTVAPVLVGMALFLSAGAALAHSDGMPFKSSGSGTQVAGGPPECQFGGTCTVTSDGIAASSHLGRGPYSSTLTLDYTDIMVTGPDGYCVPTSGTSTLTAANGDQVFIRTSGYVCAAVTAGAVHTLTATYTITGGTGRFSGATGSGTEQAVDDGGANSSYSLSGTIDY